MKLNQRTFTLAITGLIGVALLTAGLVNSRRIQYENTNRKVETVLSLTEVKKLSILGGKSVKQVLGTLNDETQITSIAIEEKTLFDFIEEGRLTLLKGSEIINAHRVGHVNRFVLNHLYNRGRKPNPDHFYLIIEKIEDYEQIRDIFRIEFGSDRIKETPRWNIIEVVDERDDLLEVGLGVDLSDVSLIQSNGFKPVIRFQNPKRLTKEIIEKKLRTITPELGDVTLIFKGESILGYPKFLGEVEAKVQQENVVLGVVEFAKQYGARQIANSHPYQSLKVHSIPEEVMEVVSPEKAATRYIRAAKERNARVIFLHPFLDVITDQGIIDYNVNFFNTVVKGLESSGFTVEKISNTDFSTYQPAQALELFVISMGVMAALAWAICLFLPRQRHVLPIFVGLGAALFYACNSVGVLAEWSRIMALILACITPTIALIMCFPKTAEVKLSLPNLLTYIIKLIVICLGGALLITAFLSDLSYLIGNNQFFGVKISFMLPLVLIGLFFYLRPHRITSIIFVFKRLLSSSVRTAGLLAVFFSIAFIFIYILRSGNYMTFQIPYLEESMRGLLEKVLFIRPRTKEFLIGYPFLVLAYTMVDKEISRHWLWFFNILGSVALISLINSFCHLHTPLLVSLYRSALGAVIGVVLGIIALLVLRALQRLAHKLHH